MMGGEHGLLGSPKGGSMSDIPLGRMCWHELMTTDPEAAPGFYQAITGWGTQDFEGGPEPYKMWTNGGVPLGGLMQLPEEARAAGAPDSGR